MDCEMPIIDGWETTMKLRLLHSSGKIQNLPPIIGITGHTTPAELQRYLQVGMIDTLIKPCTQRQLIQMIEKHLAYDNTL